MSAMFTSLVLRWLLAASLAGLTAAEFELQVENSSLYDDEGRLLVIPVSANDVSQYTLNLTTIAIAAAAILGPLLSLLGAAALGALLYGLLLGTVGTGFGTGTGGFTGTGTGGGFGFATGTGTGTGGGFGGASGGGFSGGGGGGGGYSSYSSYARSFDPYAIDWEKFSIIDWIAIGEEAWRKFDPADLECQKRLICEIHQNTSRFGTPAARLVDVFSYLQYAEVLSLPDEIKVLIEEYNDAADRGRSLQKDCGEVYTTCDFSVKKLMDKYSHNEV